MDRRTRLLLMPVMLLGCGDGAPPASPPLAVDSAGLRIVTHVSPPVRTGVLGEAPLIRLGDGAQNSTTLYRVRGGVLADAEGLIIANAGFHEILYVSADGGVLRRAGAEGDGPGEFRAISWMHGRSDGGVNIGDARTLRVTAMDGQGEVIWTRPFNSSAETPEDPRALVASGFVLGATDDGAILGFPSGIGLLKGRPGLVPVVAELRLYSQDGSSSETRGERNVFTWYEKPGAEGFPLGNMLGGARLWFSGHSNRIALTESRAFQIDVFDHGALSLRIREVRSRIPFQPDSVPANIDFVADSTPTYSELQVDSRQRIWARAAVSSNETEWRVFDVDGNSIGVLRLPEDASVLDADESRLLLLRRDEVDLESIEVWRLSWSEL